MDSLILALKILAQGVLLLIGGSSLFGIFFHIHSMSVNMEPDYWENFDHFVSKLESEILKKLREEDKMDKLREEFELCKRNTVTNNRCVIISGVIVILVLGVISFLCLWGIVAL